MDDPLRWDESLAMGFGELDKQHQGLLEKASGLVAAAAAGPPWQALGDALLELEMLTRVHVAEEEWLMRWLAYPLLPEHAKQHRDFLRQLHWLRAALDHTKPSRRVVHALTADLASALLTHLEHADRLVGTYAFEHVLSG